MYHYVYLIINPVTNMQYIGVRTSKVLPELDVSYWGSSKHLPKDVSTTHNKEILACFFTRKDAVDHEIYLHNLHDVAVNPLFYNKAKQTSTKFDTTGTKLSEKHAEQTRKNFLGKKHSESTKKKLSDYHKGKPKSKEACINMSIAQKRYAASPNYRNPNKGTTKSDEMKQRISQTKKMNGDSASTNPTFVPWFITDTVSGITTYFYDKTKNEYANEIGITIATLKSAIKRSKGIKPIKRGALANLIIGNINKDIV